ncbi:MAG: hypothetical protein JW744_05530 [Candidatus Diapherotrites archaeon]|uniref:Uncharacterized protein n=1 Tax=Candidatus Iainarchaeum sp. TaxID=3101447 RepID=A0A938YTN1_9ARCH|nr:hypothetical protein [Candidatus Diapherotrites archaeon]
MAKLGAKNKKRVFPFGDGKGKSGDFPGKKDYEKYRSKKHLADGQWELARQQLEPRRRQGKRLVDATKRVPSRDCSFTLNIGGAYMNCTVAKSPKQVTVTVQHPHKTGASASFIVSIEKVMEKGLLSAVEKQVLGPKFKESFRVQPLRILEYAWRKAA